jgi:RNA polymerase sigma-70 factor (ECF subfamily)
MLSNLKDASAAFLEIRERVYAYLLAVVRDRTLAEDLFQELYVALADTLEKGEAIEDLEAWCRGVARNLALRHWRSQRTSKVVPGDNLLDLIDRAFDENTDQLGHLDQMKVALSQCRQELAPPARDLLDLRYSKDLPIAEISQATRRTPRGVITALARIREQLLECIAKRMPEAPA